MHNLLKNITLSKNRLKLYKFSTEDLSMSKKKEVRGVPANLKITKSDDEFLSKISELSNEKKYMRGKMCYQAFKIGLEILKAEIEKEIDKKTEHIYLTNQEILKNNEIVLKNNEKVLKRNKNLNGLVEIIKLLEKNGIEVNITKKDESE